jgi:DNA-binding NarL/FixJ family response regulator
MQRPRILLADDNPEVLSRVAEILTPRYEVVGAVANGCDLVSETVRTDPDLIVLDFSLPLKDGIQASREIRQLGLRAKLIFLTTQTHSLSVLACLANGAQGYILKSQMMTHLGLAIETVLNGSTFATHLIPVDPAEPSQLPTSRAVAFADHR